MKIYVSGAVCEGPTSLAAFDSALIKCNVANYNLLRLSSVIPPHSEVIETDKVPDLPGEWGDRLYVVYAEMRSEVINEEAWAGVGWVMDSESGKGLFVEHEGHSETSVRNDITNTLQSMLEARGMEGLEIQIKVVGGMCHGHPICALVVAAYQVSDWNNQPYLK